MDPFTIALIGGGLLSGIGSLFGARSANKAANAQNARVAGLDAQTMAFLGGLGGPSSRSQNPLFGGTPGLAQMGLQQYTGQIMNQGAGSNPLEGFQLPGPTNVYRDFGLATDPILQSMRGGPNDAAMSMNLLDILGGGSSFDSSIVSSALDPIRKRNLRQQAAALNAGASGLGQRFGSAMRRSETELRRSHLEDTAAIDAQMAFAAHEAAQARRLQAAQSLLGMGQLQLGRDTGALTGYGQRAGIGIQEGALGIDRSRLDLDARMGAGNLGLAQQGQSNQLLQLLLGHQTNQNQQYLQGLGMMYGQPVAGAPGYGPAIGDLGQLLLFSQLMRGQQPVR